MPFSNLDITGFSGSDWGTYLDDRRSISGYCVFLGPNFISWSSKKQHSVSKSSTEAEYRALAQLTSDITWISHPLKELQVESKQIPTLWIDNQSAISLASNTVLHAITKHVEIDHYFVRETVSDKIIQVNYIPPAEQIADLH